MPIYDYQCPSCNAQKDDVYASVEEREIPCECGKVMSRLPPGPKGFLFRSGYYEHITEEPIFCKTKADLRAATRDHNCTSDYAE